MFALRAPEGPPKDGKAPVRDNLVAELMKTVPSMDGLETGPFDFSDGTKGLITGYRFVMIKQR